MTTEDFAEPFKPIERQEWVFDRSTPVRHPAFAHMDPLPTAGEILDLIEKLKADDD